MPAAPPPIRRSSRPATWCGFRVPTAWCAGRTGAMPRTRARSRAAMPPAPARNIAACRRSGRSSSTFTSRASARRRRSRTGGCGGRAGHERDHVRAGRRSYVAYALGINAQRDIATTRRLIERRIAVDPAALADPTKPLADFLKAKQPLRRTLTLDSAKAHARVVTCCRMRALSAGTRASPHCEAEPQMPPKEKRHA